MLLIAKFYKKYENMHFNTNKELCSKSDAKNVYCFTYKFNQLLQKRWYPKQMIFAILNKP